MLYLGETDNKPINNISANMIGAIKKIKLDNVRVTQTSSLGWSDKFSLSISPCQRVKVISE